jgi:hypothetical protein
MRKLAFAEAVNASRRHVTIDLATIADESTATSCRISPHPISVICSA